jgi:hypothetical protein
MLFKQWLFNETNAQLAYHVTAAMNLPEIEEKGLTPGYQPANWQGYANWSEDKNFFASDLQGAKYWISKLQDIIDSKYEPGAWHEDNFVSEMAIPIIVRFRFNRRAANTSAGGTFSDRWGDDVQGNKAGYRTGNYYTDRTIPYYENTMQFWDGVKWNTDFDPNNINVALFVTSEAAHPDDFENEPDVPEEARFYWTWKEPYPMPYGR